MKLRKILAILLSIAMVTSLIVVPVSSATVNDTGSFEDIIPTEGSAPGDIIYSEIETIEGAATASAGLDWTTVESLPLGGALYLDFSEGITGTSNSATNYITLHVDMEGSNGTISLQFGVDTSNTIRAQSGSGWTGANSAVAPYGTINLAEGFELIVKHNTAGTADYWLKKAGEDEFTCTLAGVAIGANNNRTTGITAAGNAVANVTAATLYMPETYYETAALEDIITTSETPGEETFAVLEEHTERTVISSESGTVTGFTNSIPVGGILRYDFESATISSASAMNEDFEGSNGGHNLYFGTNASYGFRIKSGSSYMQIAPKTMLDMSKPFSLIVKHTGSGSTPLEYWLSTDGNETYKLIAVAAPENNQNRKSQYDGANNIVLSYRAIYKKDVVPEPEIEYETSTFDEILPTEGEVGDTVFTSVAEVEETTLNSSTSTTFDKQIPLGGAVHYKFDNVRVTSSVLGGANYVLLNETLSGGGLANNMVLAAGTQSEAPKMAIRIREGSTYQYPAGYNILDFSQAFEIIVKHNQTSGTFEYWLKSNGEEDFKFLGEWAPENNTRASSHSAGGTAIADGFSAVMYGTTVVEEPEEPEIVYETATEEELLPKT